MKIQRAKNASRNIFFGIILKIVQLLMPFLLRTAMMAMLGLEYLGLNSLFSSIIQVLNLAELGVGSAMVFGMYKPIATGDKETIRALMRLYRKYYRIIGGAVFFFGILLIPFLPKLIKGGIPSDLNLYLLYGLNLGVTVLSYWLFAYKNSILTAHQRNDVISRITLIIEIFKYLVQISVLYFCHSYYLFLITALVSQVLLNIVTALVANKMFPEYFPEGKLPGEDVKELNRKIKDLFTAKIGGTVTLSADTLVISGFLGLSVLAVYQNYYFIVSALMGILVVIYTSFKAGIGNALVIESESKNYQIFNTLSMLFLWLAGWCTVCLLCLSQPFMAIWMGEDYLLDYAIVVCICANFFVYESIKILCLFKDAAGIWHQDRYRPLVCSLANLAMNIMTVKWLGLYGVVLSTIISLALIGIPWLLYNLFTTLYKINIRNYLKRRLADLVILAMGAGATIYICSLLPETGFFIFIVKMCVCAIVPNLLYLLFFSRREEFKFFLQIMKGLLPGRTNK